MGQGAVCVSVGERELGAALLGSGGCCPVLSCSLIPLLHINVFSSLFELTLFWSQ